MADIEPLISKPLNQLVTYINCQTFINVQNVDKIKTLFLPPIWSNNSNITYSNHLFTSLEGSTLLYV